MAEAGFAGGRRKKTPIYPQGTPVMQGGQLNNVLQMPLPGVTPNRPAPAAEELRRQLIRQEHPRYREWAETWRELGYLFEGDGPYMDGTALVAHPRELIYELDEHGQPIAGRGPTGEKPKYTRRRLLARYENWVEGLIGIFVDHQYAKGIVRNVPNWDAATMGTYPYLDWIHNVDGQGTHIDDWFKWCQSLVNLYGFVWVVADRAGTVPGADAALSMADLGRPVLRVYVPTDVPDWLADRYNNIRSIKVVERRVRDSLMDAAFLQEPDTESGTQDAPHRDYRIWTEQGWALYDGDGNVLSQGDTPGFLPVLVFYCRRRARIPVIGRSLLGDPKVFRDYYNLVSEKRAIMRDQTFSMLNITLGERQSVDEARQLLGNKVSTETVLLTKGDAKFIAPEDGPADVYEKEKESLLRTTFRRLGLPWESDSMDAEAEGSRRLKAMDLNRTLAGMSDEAQKAEYGIARMFHRMEFGVELGDMLMESAGLTIRHPDEFNTEELMQVALELRETLTLGFGPTANAEMRKKALPLILPDLDESTREVIEEEIDAEAIREQTMKVMMDESMVAAPGEEPIDEPEPGADEGGAEDEGVEDEGGGEG